MDRKIIFSGVFIIALALISFSSPKDKKMLLFYTTIDDSISLHRRNPNWINNGACLQLKIDTINLLFVDEFKDRKRFYYNGSIFYKSQLFELNTYQYLRNCKIQSFTVSCSGTAFEPPYVKNDSSCLSAKQFSQIKEYYKTSKEYGNNKYILYFHEINAINVVNKNIINLNQITCKIN